jgi:hypothetical protein
MKDLLTSKRKKAGALPCCVEAFVSEAKIREIKSEFAYN